MRVDDQLQGRMSRKLSYLAIRESILVLAIALTSTSLWLIFVRWPGPLLSEILFFRGIIAAALAMLIIFAASTTLYCMGKLRQFAKAVYLSIALACLQICFLTVFPVSFDRSITIFLLSRIHAEAGKADVASLEESLISQYIVEEGAVRRRLSEQVAVGNVQYSPSGDIQLSNRGIAVLCFAQTLQGLFSYKNKHLSLICE